MAQSFFHREERIPILELKEDKIIFIGNIVNSDKSLDCSNLYIFPGLIDTQCHFREPGGEHKETIETGTMSAALGGITGIFEMPNTNPLTTTPEALEHKIKRGVDTAYTDFAFYFGGTHENSSNLSNGKNCQEYVESKFLWDQVQEICFLQQMKRLKL